MKKLTPSFIAAAVALSIYSQSSFADSELCNEATNACLADVPKYDRPLVDGDVDTLPIEVSADNFEVNFPNRAVYSGKVSATQGNRTVNSEQIILEQTENRNMLLKGDIFYEDNFVEIKGDEAQMNLDNNDVQIKNSQYHLMGRLGRGSADNILFTNNRYITLENGSFTSCPINDSSWNIEGSKIIYDNQEQLLEVWDAKFRIGKVPVLYLPYLQLPTGDKRRSGLLMPSFSYDSIGGIDISQPIYWNIAANYDATFTPRIIQERGVQLQTEMRYLNYLGLGTVAFDWLQHDALYAKNRANSSNKSGYSDNSYRWLFHWKNDELINYNWRFSVDATRVSDNQYITDLGSKYASETDGYLTQHYQINYADEYWDIGLNYKYFQALRNDIKDNLYRTEPQLNINYYNNDIDNLNIKMFGQVSHFVSSGDNNPKAWRFHFEPTLDYTLMSSWASVTLEGGFLATHYNQDIPNTNQYAYLDKNVNRFMPKLGVDGKIIFERDFDSVSGYTQTLEPRVKYLYIPYRDQSQINNYDSSLLQSDYIGLFRDQPYSGLDRIASSNKVATGLTTRIYDENKVEQFNLSLGQIYYFNKSRTGLNSTPFAETDGTGSITWATDAFWRINDNIITRSGIQYDTRINEISLASAVVEYRANDSKLIQLSYRYANKNYINSIALSTTPTPYQQSISQVGVMAAWPVTDTVSMVGSVFYDIDNKQSTDSYVGVHYADCCWGVTVQYGRKITDWDSYSQQSQYENKLSINFELRGFSNDNNAVAKMLDFGLLPYKTAFENDYGN